MAKYVEVGEYRYMTQDGSGHQITPIGRGSYGTVWLGEHKKSNTRVAIKKSENRELYMNKFIDNELQIHKNVQHPNLVRCYHVEDKYIGSSRHISMVLEYMPGGDMEAYLAKKYPHGMPEAEARRFLTQIAAAFQYLSSKGLVHRDLKPANMLLTDWSNGQLPTIKIADFGFARNHSDLMMTKVGSPLYMAPEVLNSQPYTSVVDVWSAGIIFIQLLTGKRPFPEARVERDIVDFINDSSKFKALIDGLNLSEGGKNVVRRMLAPRSKDRLSWEEFMSLEYIRPSVPQSALDRSTQVNGVSQWMLIVTCFETGVLHGIATTPTTTVEALRSLICPILHPGLGDPSQIMLLTTRQGEMEDGATVGDYFKPPVAPANAAAAPQTENTLHVILKSTYNGDFRIWNESIPALPTIGNGDKAPAQLNALPPLQVREILKSGLFASQVSSDQSSKWHTTMTHWRDSLDAHISHVDSLALYTQNLTRIAKGLAYAINRQKSFLVVVSQVRLGIGMLMARFKTVQQVIKEISPVMKQVRKQIPAMFIEAKSITFEAVCQAFPALPLPPTSNIAELLNEVDMKRDLVRCEDIHRNLLSAECLFGPSSDPEAAESYNLTGFKYTGPSLTPTMPVAPQDSHVPPLIKQMVQLNTVMGDFKHHLRQKLEAQSIDFHKACIEFDRYQQLFATCAANSRAALLLALDKPTNFVLTAEMVNPVHSTFSSLADSYDALMEQMKAVMKNLQAMVDTRVELDSSVQTLLKSMKTLRQPFEEFEALFQTDLSPAMLDFVGSKPKSLARLIPFPSVFKDIIAETERRRQWSDAMRLNAKETRDAYTALLNQESEMRASWYAVHSQLLGRFKDLFPTGYEILQPHAEGSLNVNLQLNGLNTYPKIQSPFATDTSYTTSGTSQTVPIPQNPTEEEYARLGAQALLQSVFSLLRELDIVKRQRLTFFQQGTDPALRQEYERALNEIAALKEENKALKREYEQRRN